MSVILNPATPNGLLTQLLLGVNGHSLSYVVYENDAAAIAAGHPGRNITQPGVPEIQPIIPTSTMTAIQYKILGRLEYSNNSL